VRIGGSPLLLALAGLVAFGAPAAAQDAALKPDNEASSAICRFHGEGCAAAPAEWAWQRSEPKIGVYSVEIPCDARQAVAFGQILAVGKPGFPAGNTRACMKASSGFTATLLGLTALPDDTKSPETDALLQGAPDLFTAFSQNTVKGSVPLTTFKGRRAAINSIEKDSGRTKVAIIEVGRFALVMLIADIRADFPGTPEEAAAVTDRFFDSLEIAE
jgi:hypothetical protein